MSNSAEYWFGNRYDQNSIKDGLRGPLGGRAEAVKPCKKYENERKKELKALKKQNKMLYIIAKNFGLRYKLKKIKKIKNKDSKKHCDSSSDYSSDQFYSDSSISRNID